MRTQKFDVIVIGSGIAGMTAAHLARKSGLSTLNLERALFGGLIVNVNELDGLDGGEVTSGSSLAAALMADNQSLGVVSKPEAAVALRREGGAATVVTEGGTYSANAVVVASGARLRTLGIPGEAEYTHRGVSSCADCDGPIFRGQPVVVVGGGDSALQEALVLAHHCPIVHLVHRGAAYRARPHLVEAVSRAQRITPIWNSVVDEIVGDEAVTGVEVRDLRTGNVARVACAGVFVYVGLAPNVEFVPSSIRRDAEGFIVTNAACETSMSGVFAVGAVRAGNPGLVVDAIAEARKAIRSVQAQSRPVPWRR